MRRQACALGSALAAIFVAGAFGACSDSARPPPPGQADASVLDAAPVSDATIDTAPPVIDAGGVDVGLGVNFVTEPDTPCVPRGGVGVVLYAGAGAVVDAGMDAAAADAGADGGGDGGADAGDGGGADAAGESGVDAGGARTVPALDFVRVVGARRVAEGSAGEGFVTFDADGGNPSASPTALTDYENRVASTGSAILVAGTAAGATEQVLVGRYDPNGAPRGGATTLASERADSIAVGGGSGLALVAWSSSQGVRAAGLAADGGPAGAVFDLAVTHLTNALSASIVDDGSGRFAVAFSGDDTGLSIQTVFARATTTARVGDPFVLFSGKRPRSVVQLVKTPAGYALVVSAGGPDSFAALVLLDATGHVTGAGHALAGTTSVYGIAVHGSELGVVARRQSVADASAAAHAVEFRPFDAATAAPLGPWVCLDGPSTDTDENAAIDADGAGYAVVYRAPDRSEVFVRFDHLGTGNP